MPFLARISATAFLFGLPLFQFAYALCGCTLRRHSGLRYAGRSWQLFPKRRQSSASAVANWSHESGQSFQKVSGSVKEVPSAQVHASRVPHIWLAPRKTLGFFESDTSVRALNVNFRMNAYKASCCSLLLMIGSLAPIAAHAGMASSCLRNPSSLVTSNTLPCTIVAAPVVAS